MGRCPIPCQRDFIPLESQLWLESGLVCSPPLGGFACGIFSYGWGEDDGALPQTLPKGFHPFGIPTLANLRGLLVALGRQRLRVCSCS